MDRPEKVRENRLRRAAGRRDLHLERSRRRDVLAPDYGKYKLYADGEPPGDWLTLTQVEERIPLIGIYNKGDEMGTATREDEIVRAKWTLDGAETLAEAAQKARAFADDLQKLHDEGYVLRGPVDGDYGFYYKPA